MQELERTKKELQKQGIATEFKHKGNTREVQGVIFEKNRYKFNGSKIDRQFSFGKIDFQLQQNHYREERRDEAIYIKNQSRISESVTSVLDGLFDFQPSGTDCDPDEAELLKQHKYRKKKRGIKL